MKNCQLICVFCFLLFIPVQVAARQQPDALNGVVWEVPGDLRSAAEDLLEMKSVGIEAIRTGLVFDDGLLSMADSLGLLFFRELPYFGLSALSMGDSLAVADSLVSLLLAANRYHVSAGPIGLTRHSDTSSLAACEPLSKLSARIRSAGGRSYYVTSFIEDDLCSNTVDFVLIDALDERWPAELVYRWKSVHSVPVGMARIGTSFLPGAPDGTLNAGSEQYQARFLEDALTRLSTKDVVAVFAHRWRDEDIARQQPPDPYGRAYGLYSRDREPRASLYVLRGMYEATQKTFAFEKGTLSESSFRWYTLLGWILLCMIAIMYAGSHRFRSMIPRYFFAHGFFRNAVREAREVLPLTSTVLLTVTGLSIGMIGSLVVSSFRGSGLAQYAYSHLSNEARISLTAVLDAPLVLTVLIGSAALLSMALWMALFLLVSGSRKGFYPSQALMLAVWPRWQVLFILPVAMTFEATANVPVWSILLLTIAWIGSAYWATIRTARDLYQVARIAPGTAILVWLFNPLIIGSVVLAIWALFHADETAFAWHLITRS